MQACIQCLGAPAPVSIVVDLLNKGIKLIFYFDAKHFYEIYHVFFENPYIPVSQVFLYPKK